MARTKSNESLDEQIDKAKVRLEKAKAQYDSAAADLRKLLEERESRQQKLLIAAIKKSDKSFEDILRFLES
jgi:flagellar biosynthesis chaperone FliJ